MTVGVSNQTQRTEVKGYVQGPFQLGKFADGWQVSPGVKGGLQVQKKSFHAGGEIGVGPFLFQGRAEVGHKFRLNDNMNLDLVGLADYKSELGNPNKLYLNENIKFNDEETQRTFESNQTFNTAWNNDAIRVGAKAELQYSTPIFAKKEYPKLNIGLGLEGGYQATTNGDISFTSNVNCTNDNGTIASHNGRIDVKRDISSGYITPTASIELAASKNFSFIAKGDFNQGDIGVRFTF